MGRGVLGLRALLASSELVLTLNPRPSEAKASSGCSKKPSEAMARIDPFWLRRGAQT